VRVTAALLVVDQVVQLTAVQWMAVPGVRETAALPVVYQAVRVMEQLGKLVFLSGVPAMILTAARVMVVRRTVDQGVQSMG
jgi:hypothetical protein